MSPLLKNRLRLNDEKNLVLKYSLTAAGLAFIIMVVFFITHNNTLTFGEATVLRMDLYHQYGPLYAEVYDRIMQGQSLVYSWTTGLGAGFLGNLFNYCSSPFAVLMLIFGHKNMPEAIAVMIMLKAMLAAFSFTYYINKSNNCAKKESIIFGLCYAFCGYFVAFSWNIMWFDAVAVFPFVILGIERIIQYNKPAMYIAAMTYTMITNYYMAYMVCILSVMYFLYYYFGRYELTSKIFAKKLIVEEPVVEEISEITDIAEEDISEIEIIKEEVLSAETDFVININEALSEEKTEISDETAVETVEFAEPVAPDTLTVDEAEVTEKKKKCKKEKKHRFADNRFWVSGWSFALSSFLCFALAAFALLPIYYCLQTSSATSGNFPEEFKQYFDIFTFVSNHLPGVESTIRSSGDNVIPNVYCGLLSVMLLPVYFLSDKIPGKQKIVSAILLISFFLGFVLNQFNYIWHGFHMPNDLPYRWSFAYSFLLLLLAFKAFQHIEEFSKKAYIGIGFAVFVFLIFAEKFEIPNVTELTIVLGVVFTLLYVIIFGMLKSEKYRKNSIIALLFFTVMLEIVVADSPKIVMQQPKDAYTSDYENYLSISDSVESEDTELFYRTELTKLRTRMDASWYGYNGVSIFSSMAYEHTAKIMEKLGLFGNNINSYTYYPQTPVFNSFFNLKYLYDNQDFLTDNDFYTSVGSNDDFDAYKYNYYLPLMFAVDSDIKDWDYASGNPFTVQNALISSSAGVSDVFIPVEATDITEDNLNDVSLSSVNSSTTFSVSKASNSSDGKATVKIKPTEDGYYYIYVGSTKLSGLYIKAGDVEYNYNSSSIQPFVFDLGYLTTEDEAEIRYTIPSSTTSATLTFCAARLDKEKFDEAYDKLEGGSSFELEVFDETYLKGTVNVSDSDSVLWTSIPYDESWEITVDGKLMTYTQLDPETAEVTYDGEIEKIGGGLIGIEIERGVHTIELSYKANGLSTGIKMTAAGILIVVLLLLVKLILDKKNIKLKYVPVIFRKPDYYSD